MSEELIIPEGTICKKCGEFEATFRVTYGKFLNESPELCSVDFVCELCLIDYELYFSRVNIPYKIETNPEKVTFS